MALSETAYPPPPTFSDKQWLGHPRGLFTLFFTEMWERYTYYGMRALLILFMTAEAAKGGLGLPAAQAGAVYGLYVGSVYLMALPGGWIADRLLGQQRSVWYGGILISLGNFLLAVPSNRAFFFGLFVIVMGVGLLKPNVSVIVGQLYPTSEGTRRDAGFSLFYMGINLGAFIAPLITGTIGEKVGFRYGFLVSGLAMLIGLVQYRLTGKYLGTAGASPMASSPAQHRRGWTIVGVAVAVALVIFAAGVFGLYTVDVVALAKGTGAAMAALAVFFFGYTLIFGGLSREERGRVMVIAVFFAAAALFWAGFEQAGSTFSLFIRDYTDRSAFGSHFADGLHPASWYQSANALFIIAFAPVFAWLWVDLGRRRLDPSAPAKFGLGLILMGVGFLVMYLAVKAVVASPTGKVAPTWILLTFLIHTFAELCLSPVGLSNVTKLAPARYAGQMMGTWFLAAALGNLIAGLLAGEAAAGPAAMGGSFFNMLLFGVVLGGLLLLVSPWLKKLMHGVR